MIVWYVGFWQNKLFIKKQTVYQKTKCTFQKSLGYILKILQILHLHNLFLPPGCLKKVGKFVTFDNVCMTTFWDCLSLLTLQVCYASRPILHVLLMQSWWVGLSAPLSTHNWLNEMQLTLLFTFLCASRSALFPARAMITPGLAKDFSLLIHSFALVNVTCMKSMWIHVG